MSFSLQLENGDLALSGTSLGTVTGAAKLQQDLICAILTPYGFSELHPTFGSTLVENVINPNAQEIIGMRDFNYAATLVNAELQRICANYQAQQIARKNSDGYKFGKSTLTPNELLLAVQGIDFTQTEDKMLVILRLEIGNQIVVINVPIEGS